jgi:hypothetical protein
MDRELTKQVLAQTCPTSVALTFLDYVFPWAASASSDRFWALNTFITCFEKEYGVPVSYISVGPGQIHTHTRIKTIEDLNCYPEHQTGC